MVAAPSVPFPVGFGAKLTVAPPFPFSGLGDRGASILFPLWLGAKIRRDMAGSGADLGVGLGVHILPQPTTAPKLSSTSRSPTFRWNAGSLA